MIMTLDDHIMWRCFNVSFTDRLNCKRPKVLQICSSLYSVDSTCFLYKLHSAHRVCVGSLGYGVLMGFYKISVSKIKAISFQGHRGPHSFSTLHNSYSTSFKYDSIELITFADVGYVCVF
jgi:hypothetical protein